MSYIFLNTDIKIILLFEYHYPPLFPGTFAERRIQHLAFVPCHGCRTVDAVGEFAVESVKIAQVSESCGSFPLCRRFVPPCFLCAFRADLSAGFRHSLAASCTKSLFGGFFSSFCVILRTHVPAPVSDKNCFIFAI